MSLLRRCERCGKEAAVADSGNVAQLPHRWREVTTVEHDSHPRTKRREICRVCGDALDAFFSMRVSTADVVA